MVIIPFKHNTVIILDKIGKCKDLGALRKEFEAANKEQKLLDEHEDN